MNIYKFYVYAYLRENGLPYYIGKGTGNRAYAKHSNINAPKNKSLIVFLEKNLSEIGAMALERRYIRWYGKKEQNGVLMNVFDGGEGFDSSTSRKIQNNLINSGKHHLLTNNPNNTKVCCEYCGKILGIANYNQWHGKKCKLGPTPKIQHTKIKELNSTIKTCKYCNIQVNVGNYYMYHGEKCKLKPL